MNRQITEQSTPTQKQEVVRAAIASVVLEGFEPSQAVRDLLDQYIEGKISVEELQEKGLSEAKASINNVNTQ